METEHIKEFLVMAEKLNYTAASDDLFISQSSLFKHIRALEEELGVAFFAKEGKRVVMTEYGKKFVHHAEVMLRQIDSYQSEVEALREAQANTIDLIEVNPNPELAFAFKKAYPQFKLNTKFITAVEDAARSDTELILLRGINPFLEEKFDYIELTNDSIVVVAPNDHPLAGKSCVRLIDLKNEEFIGFSMTNLNNNNGPGDGKYDVVSICRGAGFEPNVIISAFPGSEIARLVGLGGGISLLFKKATMRRMGSQVSYINIEPEMQVPVRLYYRKGRELSDAEKDYINFTKEWYETLYK